MFYLRSAGRAAPSSWSWARLSDPAVHVEYELEDMLPACAQVRLPGDLTGRGASYTFAVQHPQYRADCQGEWHDRDIQRHGQQHNEDLN